MTLATARKTRVLVRIPATQNIKVLLAVHRITQAELAEAMGLRSRTNLNALIAGRRLVSADNKLARRIADYFGQPVDALFPLVDLGEIAASTSPPLSGMNDYKLSDTCQEKNTTIGDQSPPEKRKKQGQK